MRNAGRIAGALSLGFVILTHAERDVALAQGTDAYAATVIATPNLLGYWRFSAASQAGSEVNGYTGAFQGDAHVGADGSGPALTGDAANSALVLDGSGDWMKSDGAKPLAGQIGDEGTMLLWLNLDVLPSAAGRIFSLGAESQGGNDLDFQIETDDRCAFYTEGGAGTESGVAFTAAGVGVWHFVAATFKAGVENSRVIYLDGVPVGASTPGGHSTNTSLFNVGENDVFTGRFFQGRLDEVALFDRALTAEEIACVYEKRVYTKVVESYFLPKSVKAKANAKDASKSSLTAEGIFDTGPLAADLASAATLDVGKLHFDITELTPRGAAFVYEGDGATFSITPNPYGSSRAKFKLKYTGDLTGKVELDGPLDLRFADAASDGLCTVNLGGGGFRLGKVGGALVKPTVFLQRVSAKLKGAGKDALTVVVGIGSGGTTPAEASDLTVEFGANLAVTIPAGSFVRKGDADVFAGDVGGIKKATVDYARDQIAITGKALDLGTFAEGANQVDIVGGGRE